MKSSLYHVEIRVSHFGRSLTFYAALFKYLGWHTIELGNYFCGWQGKNGSLWIVATEKPYRRIPFHRKHTGLNHIAFRVGRRDVVDAFYRDFLLKRKIPVLYGGPKEYPEYRQGYYAVYFEDPDRIKLEVVYIPRG